MVYSHVSTPAQARYLTLGVLLTAGKPPLVQLRSQQRVPIVSQGEEPVVVVLVKAV
jgi:hypothetical protein